MLGNAILANQSWQRNLGGAILVTQRRNVSMTPVAFAFMNKMQKNRD
tara:strand:- start:561 stop:701 length:141 start_codon:yes stop_codon:yes gene_type:complete